MLPKVISQKPYLTINTRGDQEWRLPNGDLHREDGPAVIRSNGETVWFLNGQKHRLVGPAIYGGKFKSCWYVNDVYLPILGDHISSLESLIATCHLSLKTHRELFESNRFLFQIKIEAILKLAKHNFSLSEKQVQSLRLLLDLTN